MLREDLRTTTSPSWYTIDRTLRALARKRAALDAEEARCCARRTASRSGARLAASR